jgi:hypothetical protein
MTSKELGVDLKDAVIFKGFDGNAFIEVKNEIWDAPINKDGNIVDNWEPTEYVPEVELQNLLINHFGYLNIQSM